MLYLFRSSQIKIFNATAWNMSELICGCFSYFIVCTQFLAQQKNATEGLDFSVCPYEKKISGFGTVNCYCGPCLWVVTPCGCRLHYWLFGYLYCYHLQHEVAIQWALQILGTVHRSLGAAPFDSWIDSRHFSLSVARPIIRSSCHGPVDMCYVWADSNGQSLRFEDGNGQYIRNVWNAAYTYTVSTLRNGVHMNCIQIFRYSVRSLPLNCSPVHLASGWSRYHSCYFLCFYLSFFNDASSTPYVICRMEG